MNESAIPEEHTASFSIDDSLLSLVFVIVIEKQPIGACWDLVFVFFTEILLCCGVGFWNDSKASNILIDLLDIDHSL